MSQVHADSKNKPNVHLFVEYKDKVKQNEQNSMGLIDTEKWLVLTKEEGLGWVGVEGEGNKEAQ